MPEERLETRGDPRDGTHCQSDTERVGRDLAPHATNAIERRRWLVPSKAMYPAMLVSE